MPQASVVKSRFSEREAQVYVDKYAREAGCNEDVALRVYTSRLIGQDATLVLHGGGNTSVKTKLPDDTGEMVDVLCVKGSGWDLGYIEPAGLPAVRLASLDALKSRETLSDEEMVNAQRTRLLDASSPNPSVETLLHAFLPHKFIDHSHADAILALVDQPNSEEVCKEVFGDSLAIVPYIMPGFDLSMAAAKVQAEHPDAEGLLLLRHGLFTYGATAKESYERHVEAVSKAEAFIEEARAKAKVDRTKVNSLDYRAIAPVIRGVLSEGERRYVLERRDTDATKAFLARTDLDDITQRGTATPDHVIRTKRVPLVLKLDGVSDIRNYIEERVQRYRDAYLKYVKTQMRNKKREVSVLDPDPRVILIPGVGVLTAGATPKAARVAADVYEHTVDVIASAEAIGRYEPLPPDDLFDMEYWSLEQAKLGKKAPKPMEGRVVYITGAASGIGKACARAFSEQGACLFLTDVDEAKLKKVAEDVDAASAVVDVSDEAAVEKSIATAVELYGGVDGIVSNAGIAPQGVMAEVDSATLKQSFEVNFFAHQYVAAAAVKVMQAQGRGGFLLFNASKAAFNPGPGFGPYALPKAAVVALTKQYALDYGAQGIRSNAVNADRIRTGLMKPEFVEERAKKRGIEADEYFKSNLLKREVTASDVAQAFVNLALAESTTGCVVTVDGGNIAASPR